MSDIHVRLDDTSPSDFVEALAGHLPDDWRRDGILEHQVSTQEEVQYCFRNEPTGERPRSGLCLAGPADQLTVAAVVPIDRGIDFSDEQYDTIVAEFYEEVVEPTADELEVEAEYIPREEGESG